MAHTMDRSTGVKLESEGGTYVSVFSRGDILHDTSGNTAMVVVAIRGCNPTMNAIRHGFRRSKDGR